MLLKAEIPWAKMTTSKAKNEKFYMKVSRVQMLYGVWAFNSITIIPNSTNKEKNNSFQIVYLHLVKKRYQMESYQPKC